LNYSTFASHHIPIVGIYDDHDYGVNDGNIHYSRKHETQEILLDFLEEPPDSQRRKQEGIYTSYIMNDDDHHHDGDGKTHRIKIILLDIRYHQDASIDDGLGAYIPHIRSLHIIVTELTV
jgi:alkaline phosphatase D